MESESEGERDGRGERWEMKDEWKDGKMVEEWKDGNENEMNYYI